MEGSGRTVATVVPAAVWDRAGRVKRTGPCTEGYLWLVKEKGGVPRGVSILMGGAAFLPTELDPPLTPLASLRAAAQHGIGCVTFASRHPA
jgi:hypothetical protein